MLIYEQGMFLLDDQYIYHVQHINHEIMIMIAPRIRPLVSQLRPLPNSSYQKVSDVRSATDCAPAPEVRDILTADRFLSFAPVTSDIVCRMVNETH